MVSSILPKKRTSLTILSIEGGQDNEFRSFFGTIQDAIICFRDLLTFNIIKNLEFTHYISSLC